MPTDVVLPLLTAVVAGAIAALSGFGIGSLLTPVLMLQMPTAEAVALLAIPHAWATGLRLYRLRREIHWHTFRQFGIASAAGGLGGALLQSRLGSPILTMLLAVLLLLAGSAELFRRPVPLPNTRAWHYLGGLLSGGFGGLVGNQGGVRTAALLGFGLPPRALVATATATGLLVDAARTPVYLTTHGAAVAAALPLMLLLIGGVTLGTLIGVPVLSRIPTPTYRRIVGGLLVAIGVVLLVAA